MQPSFYNLATMGSVSYSPCPIVVLAPFWEYKRLQPFWIALEQLLLARSEQIIILHYRPIQMKSSCVQSIDAVLPRAKLVIGNDAGICRLAGKAGKPAIAICNSTGNEFVGLPSVSWITGSVTAVTADQVIQKLK